MFWNVFCRMYLVYRSILLFEYYRSDTSVLVLSLATDLTTSKLFLRLILIRFWKEIEKNV